MSVMMIQSDALACPAHGCGLVFTVPVTWLQERRNDGAGFCCPNGHRLSFKTSEVDTLRRERDRLKQDIARVEEEAREARDRATAATERAQKAEAKAKRISKRAAAGTCPCCKRTFSELSEHMKRQHPEFVKATGAKVVAFKPRSAA